MADLETLDYKSISDMSTDEALEALRQIRLSRRVPTKPTKTTRKAKKKEVKVDPSSMSANQIEELLKKLGG